jgi:hypothetical protein
VRHLVGATGFEPATSSSRSHVHGLASCRVLLLALALMSVAVRLRLPVSRTVVTQLVTQLNDSAPELLDLPLRRSLYVLGSTAAFLMRASFFVVWLAA